MVLEEAEHLPHVRANYTRRVLDVVDQVVVREVLQLVQLDGLTQVLVLHRVRLILLVSQDDERHLSLQQVRVARHELEHLGHDRDAINIARVDDKNDTVNVRIEELPVVTVATLKTEFLSIKYFVLYLPGR